MVDLHYEDIKILDLDPEFFVSWLGRVVSEEGSRLGEINLIFCSDEYILDVNRTHLQHDYYTDIITFDYCTESDVSGDLFISIDRVQDNAMLEGVSFDNELNRVVVHGVLHLLGYQDKGSKDKALMTKMEDKYLEYVSRET